MVATKEKENKMNAQQAIEWCKRFPMDEIQCRHGIKLRYTGTEFQKFDEGEWKRKDVQVLSCSSYTIVKNNETVPGRKFGPSNARRWLHDNPGKILVDNKGAQRRWNENTYQFESQSEGEWQPREIHQIHCPYTFPVDPQKMVIVVVQETPIRCYADRVEYLGWMASCQALRDGLKILRLECSHTITLNGGASNIAGPQPITFEDTKMKIGCIPYTSAEIRSLITGMSKAGS